jgi:hypothetical protein
MKYWAVGKDKVPNISNRSRARRALSLAHQGTGVVGLALCGKIGGRVPAEASLLVRMFTKELGDPRGTWANDRSTRRRAG